MKLSRLVKYKYPEPERLTLAETRERKLAGALQASYKELERLEGVRAAALSQARKKTVNLSRMIVNDQSANGRKAASIAAALAGFSERDFSNPQKRAAYRALRARQEGLRNAKPSGSDQREYSPYKGTGESGFASTIYGTVARTGAVHALGLIRGHLPNVYLPTAVVPCIQRAIRREVMFALGHGGRGYHTRKRRTESSGIPC